MFISIKEGSAPHFNEVEVLMMSKLDKPAIDQARLVEEWKSVLPNTLEEADQARIWADEADQQALRVHITTAGHTGYTFDFKVTYVDSREIKTELVDVERGQEHIDERSEIVQTLINDYVRHLHECAQALKEVTHA
jgi:hypothetical protein